MKNSNTTIKIVAAGAIIFLIASASGLMPTAILKYKAEQNPAPEAAQSMSGIAVGIAAGIPAGMAEQIARGAE